MNPAQLRKQRKLARMAFERRKSIQRDTAFAASELERLKREAAERREAKA
jgi:hypothetical protein